jgi:hypothetical protein
LGDVSGTKWIVMEGLNEGESVISDGLQKVTAGAEVDARPATATEVGEDTSGDQ